MRKKPTKNPTKKKHLKIWNNPENINGMIKELVKNDKNNALEKLM